MYFVLDCNMSTTDQRQRKASRVSKEHKNTKRSALYDAIYRGQVSKIKSLLFTSSTDGKGGDTKSDYFEKNKDITAALPLICVRGAIALARQDENTIECLRLLASADISMDAKDSRGRTLLHEAVQHGRYELVRELMQLSSDLGAVTLEGHNCLHLAVINGDIKMVEILLQTMPSQVIDATDRVGRTPLYLALTSGSIQLFECLLFGGCNPNCTAPDGRAIIIHALEKGLSLQLEQLIKHGVVLETMNGFTAVHFAACQENSENIQTLAATVNVDQLCAKDKEGKTPLMYIALMGLDKNLKFLLEAKIGILDQDNDGKTALHYTATNTHRGCVDLLCRYDEKILLVSDVNGNTPGHEAIMAQNDTVLKALIENGLQIDSTDNEQHSLVHWATVYNCCKSLEFLIERGVSVSTQDNSGATALHYACQLEEESTMSDARNQILQLLITNGAAIEVMDHTGRKPIHWAASSGNRAGLELLARKGATIDVGTSTERLTALHLACSQGHSECVQFLVENSSASVNLLDITGCSPLFYACAIGETKTVKILLKAAANPNIKSVDGKRPLHCAASQSNVECLSLLVDAGAEISPQSNQGDTPLHEAASTGQQDCVTYLLNQGCQPDVANSFGATPLHYAVAENRLNVVEQLLKSGSIVNTIFPTGTSENNYVSPLDIALGNGDYKCVHLLQANGGRTGHSLVQNAATTIQHTWKAYRERKKHAEAGLESNREEPRSRRSTLSESVSVRDELQTDEQTPADVIQEQAQLTLKEKNSNTVDQEKLRNSLHMDPTEWSGNQEGSYVISSDDVTATHEHVASVTTLNSDEVQSVYDQLAQGRKAITDMRNFLLYADSLRQEFARVAMDTKSLVDSEDFLSIKTYNQRMRIARSRTRSGLSPLAENQVQSGQ